MNSHASLLSPTLSAAHYTSSTLPRKVHSTPSPLLRKVQVFICVYIIYIHKMLCLTKRRRKAYRQQYYQFSFKQKKDNYKLNADTRKQAYKHRYQEKIKDDKQLYYAKNADKIKAALRKLYASNTGPKKLSEKKKYASNPGPKKFSEKKKYASNPETKKRAVMQQVVCC